MSERDGEGVCDVCGFALEPADLADGRPVPAACCGRSPLCRRCRVKTFHDCDGDEAESPGAVRAEAEMWAAYCRFGAVAVAAVAAVAVAAILAGAR